MNREVAIISTLERLNERISKLERSSGVKGKLGTFIAANPDTELSDEIVSRALNWFDDVSLDPSDFYNISSEGLSFPVPSDDQIRRLAAFILNHVNAHEKNKLMSDVKKSLKDKGGYFRAALISGIYRALQQAYNVPIEVS
jgi:hypothetical protein